MELTLQTTENQISPLQTEPLEHHVAVYSSLPVLRLLIGDPRRTSVERPTPLRPQPLVPRQIAMVFCPVFARSSIEQSLSSRANERSTRLTTPGLD